MHSTTSHQPRQLKGQPTGGQWAAVTKAPPGDIILFDEDPWEQAQLEPEEPAPAAALAGTSEPVLEPEPTAPAPASAVPGDVNDWAEIHSLALRAVRDRSRNTAFARGELAEDLAQDVTLALLKQSADVKVTKSLVYKVARNLYARASHANRTGRDTYTSVASSDMAAWKQLDTQRQEVEREVGRALSSRELDAMAEKIRQEWPSPKHRPTRGFHLDKQRVSDERDDGEGGTYSLIDHAVQLKSAEEEVLEDHDEGVYMSAALDSVTSSERDGRDRTAHRLLHNALAEGRGVPMAKAGVMSQRQCTRARKVVGRSSEDVLSAVDEWAQGHDTERTNLLFAPYGQIGNAAKNEVADMYRDLPDYAGELYLSALMFANTRQESKLEEISLA